MSSTEDPLKRVELGLSNITNTFARLAGLAQDQSWPVTPETTLHAELLRHALNELEICKENLMEYEAQLNGAFPPSPPPQRAQTSAASIGCPQRTIRGPRSVSYGTSGRAALAHAYAAQSVPS